MNTTKQQEYKGKQWIKAREKAQALANKTGATYYAFPEHDGSIAIEIDYPKSGVEFETFKPTDSLVASETVSEEYGRRCADAMNAHDVSLYNVLKQQFNMRKASASFTAGTGAAADELQSQFNASYRANRTI